MGVARFGLIGLVFFAGAAVAQLPPGIDLRKLATMGFAMRGAGTAAWGPADEQISLAAQRASNTVIPQAKNRDREGNLALETACKLNGPNATQALHRATNMSDYVSMLPIPPGTAAMVAVNRLQAYSTGYERGADEAFDLVFQLTPALRKTVCASVKEAMAKGSK